MKSLKVKCCVEKGHGLNFNFVHAYTFIFGTTNTIIANPTSRFVKILVQWYCQWRHGPKFRDCLCHSGTLGIYDVSRPVLEVWIYSVHWMFAWIALLLKRIILWSGCLCRLYCFEYEFESDFNACVTRTCLNFELWTLNYHCQMMWIY